MPSAHLLTVTCSACGAPLETPSLADEVLCDRCWDRILEALEQLHPDTSDDDALPPV